jgi:hypothetical protein
VQSEQDNEPESSKRSAVEKLRHGSWGLGGVALVLWLVAGGLTVVDAATTIPEILAVGAFLLALGASLFAGLLAVAAAGRLQMDRIENGLSEIAQQLGRNAALLEQQAHRPHRGGQGRSRRSRSAGQPPSLILPPEVIDLTHRLDRKLAGGE